MGTNPRVQVRVWVRGHGYGGYGYEAMGTDMGTGTIYEKLMGTSTGMGTRPWVWARVQNFVPGYGYYKSENWWTYLVYAN